MIFYYDAFNSDGNPIPNLSNAEQSEKTSPYVTQLRLLRMLNRAGIDYNISTIGDTQFGYYPIGIGWFDLKLDYISLISEGAKRLLKYGRIKLLFYYHEGDNPTTIKTHIDSLCAKHHLDEDCYIFVSANTQAKDLDRFVYFGDHECFFAYINRNQLAITPTAKKLVKNFTALVRIPKDWRALIMSQLWKRGILDNSIWSFNTLGEDFSLNQKNNPIKASKFLNGVARLTDFVNNHTPKEADVLSEVEQNDHTLINSELYTQSYCNIVLETMYEVDRSSGIFITEKTWKCIKYGQPFVVAGPAGTIEHLRQLGYNVYDDGIDHSYDAESDCTERAKLLLNEIDRLNTTVNIDWINKLNLARVHNIRLFKSRYNTALFNLITEIKQL